MIIGKHIRLRAIDTDDLPLLVRWRNDPRVYRHFFEHEPLSLTMQQRWFQKFLDRENELFLIAEGIKSSEPLGTIALVDIDWRNRRAELGRILIFPNEHRNKGYGREMCSLMLDYAFAHMNLNRIYLEVFEDSETAIALYKKLGFQQEGRFREHVFADDNYRDVFVFGLLRDQYEGGSR